MVQFKLSTASLLALASYAAAHGYVSSIQAGGQTYPGADPHNPNPESPGWQAENTDLGFVEPSAFSTPAIACHKNARAPPAHATVQAGSTIKLTWNTWPESHHGPVLDYIAPCNGDCSSASAGSLNFVKIAEKGLISGSNPGFWAADELIQNGNSWEVTIPANLAPGKYVLRHEIIALHSAGNPNGAQAYPQCINLEVTGGGSATPSGQPATSFYSPNDPGILFNLYQSFDSYPIPGPAVWSG
ncbi:hypothetical protein VTO42DRAFT_4425 [Malbranchea cinnamomea]